jgi:2-polyprenyl-3-methyl-5-hydroxy-6-metoxy-1,4-benzoquinol methylase
MNFRISLARFLLRLGNFIQSLAIMAMRPDDLVEFSRKFYAKATQVQYWSSDKVLAAGLNVLETSLLAKVPLRAGRVLVLNMGGGRDAIALAKLGFEVTGVDSVPEMVQKAQDNAGRHGVQITG